jgi:hypothetical protein
MPERFETPLSLAVEMAAFISPGTWRVPGGILPFPADRGENDTAGLDPIFFFHHCFVDRVFWLWQKKHGLPTSLRSFPNIPKPTRLTVRARRRAPLQIPG